MSTTNYIENIITIELREQFSSNEENSETYNLRELILHTNFRILCLITVLICILADVLIFLIELLASHVVKYFIYWLLKINKNKKIDESDTC